MKEPATPEGPGGELLPARMLNEFAYCPRLFYLEWVQGEWEDSADTVEGRYHHRRVDRPGGAAPTALPPAEEEQREAGEASGDQGADETPQTTEAPAQESSIHARSVLLSAPRLRLIARIDLLEGEGNHVTPVDYKRGEVPPTLEQSWEPERVQLCAQGLILRENGFTCDRGILYYAGSRRRVEVPFTPDLEARTLELVRQALEVAEAGQIPPPLVDSPKCPRCSLVGICLPDETNLLMTGAVPVAQGAALPTVEEGSGASPAEPDVRRRNHASRPEEALDSLARLAEQASAAESLESLLGIEGTAARVYFSHFKGMLKPPQGAEGELPFDFGGRNRRPPRDPVNALLSYAYALLVKDFTVTLLAVGLDPYLGFYHRAKWGKPALALDLMEEFRPIIADSTVITVINNGEITRDDFTLLPGGTALTEGARRRFIQAYERRLETLVRHPVFGYSISYRRVFEVQARLLGRYLLGEIPEYPGFVTR